MRLIAYKSATFINRIARYLILVSSILFVSGNKNLAQSQSKSDLSELKFSYSEWIQYFENEPGRADVVMLGDSLTKAGNWNDSFPDHTVMNRGIAGDISGGILMRLDEVISHEPRVIFLLVGINDIVRNIEMETVKNNFEQIISRIQETDSTLVVQSPIYPGKKVNKAVRKRVKNLESWLRAYCSKNQVRYLDLNKTLAPKGHLPRQLTFDGIHLREKGYALWTEQIQMISRKDSILSSQ